MLQYYHDQVFFQKKEEEELEYHDQLIPHLACEVLI
jgi:hypothetical protein